MFTNLLIFLLIFNIFGAFVLPYIVGKQGPMSNVFLPLHVLHKYFVTAELFVITALAPNYVLTNPYIVGLAVLGLIAISDLFTGWKYYIFEGASKGDKYTAPCNDITFDFRVFVNYQYDLSDGFSPYVIQANDSRIMSDLINLSIIILILAL